ncbi:Ribosomal RNA small subunit methyltransferase D [BD1-7 clade bacterium]|uniref:Ribosomal RNA small subunit methyltransferase D n=1 Tax=BD1-7 clade bacterium TaxID=2029982 RepID=A0A5S9QCT7_9GAMM|nr:Ribosomal RNA small subunit methyltransferase D [BD1-7 clade bacterium]
MKRQRSPAKSQQSQQASQFRIIGGQWRSRKLAFPANSDLRPTPDRVRETLFNWLQDDVHQANALDLFCGSGAIGLEALSRGAATCDFVDAAANATRAIHTHLQTLGTSQGKVHSGTLPSALSGLDACFNLVFIDPPYALAHLIPECLAALQASDSLADNAAVYIECAAATPLPALPPAFQIHRHKTFGQVQSCLLYFHVER